MFTLPLDNKVLIATTVISNNYYSFCITVGVSLKLYGATIPNNSLVDLNDVLYRAPHDPYGRDVLPSNSRPEVHDEALLCVTDLEDCCGAPRTVHGDWYYPDGRKVPIGNDIRGGTSFLVNRGANEVRNLRQFYGSIRLFRRWSMPQERGRFCCELPSAADPNITQILFVNIGEFNDPPALQH